MHNTTSKFSDRELIDKGKKLSWLLRHDKKSFEAGLIDHHGWRSIDEICQSYNYTKGMIDAIVETNNKKRYEFSEDSLYIRARQGHSINVDVELSETTPSDKLYHGTSNDAYQFIKDNGLKPMSRLYVHLSSDKETAYNVGKRHSKSEEPVILVIDSKRMYNDGFKFFISNNGVWLTERVPTKYITKL